MPTAGIEPAASRCHLGPHPSPTVGVTAGVWTATPSAPLGVPFLGVAFLGVVSLLLTVETLIVLHQFRFLGFCKVASAGCINIHGISSLGSGVVLSIGCLFYSKSLVKPLASLVFLLAKLLRHLPFDVLFMSGFDPLCEGGPRIEGVKSLGRDEELQGEE